MKNQTRLQISSLLLACLFTSGLIFHSQVFSQSNSSAQTTIIKKASPATPAVSSMGQNNPPIQQLYINAGENAMVCMEDGSYPLHGTTNYAGPVMWETSGDGEFINPSRLDATYIPGDYDTSSGQVTLYLYMIKLGYDGPPMYDELVLSFESCTLPVINNIKDL